MIIRRSPRGSKNLWLTRAYFLVFYFGMGAVFPFINLFYVERHLSGTQIGFIGTISAVMALLAAPLWGRVSDGSKNPKRWLQLAMLISGLANFFLSQQTLFLLIAAFAGMDALVGPGVDPLMSAQAMEVVESEKTAGFGSIRLWGSLGFAVAAPISGWFIQMTGITTAFYIYAAGMVLSVLVLNLVSVRSHSKVGAAVNTNPEKTVSMIEVASGVWKNRELMGLILASVVMWAATNGTKFEAVYLSQMGVKESMIGWLNTVGAIIELPMMLWADRVLHRRGSAFTLKISFWICVFSLIFVVAHPSLVSFFLFRFFGGIAYSFMVVSFTVFIVERAPAQQSATVLALYTITIAGVVNILFSPISGMIFDAFGAYWLYVLAMAGYIIGAVIFHLMVREKTVTIRA